MTQRVVRVPLNVEFMDTEIITESKYIVMITIINGGFSMDLKTSRKLIINGSAH